MSLISLLNADSSSSSASSTSLLVSQALQTIADKKAATASTSTTTSKGTNGSSVVITTAARRAAAEKADAAKTAADLTTELRSTLDAAYKKAGKTNSADLTAMSGRALATIALNESGKFSKSEIAAAKTELRARDRQSIVAEINSGPLTAASLTAYTKNLLATRSTTSAEERQLRDANPNFR